MVTTNEKFRIASPDLVVVLGMHRSGTSAITRGLQTLGITLGDKLMPPLEGNNPTGFWEDLDFYHLNEAILHQVGSDWHFVNPITDTQVETLRKEGFIERAIALLELKLSQGRPFGLKDPRIAKLMPFWQEVFKKSQLEVGYILASRNPASVAESLAVRDGFDYEKSYLLWLDHTLTAVTSTRNCRRVVVEFDEVIKDPAHQIGRISRALALPVLEDELQRYAEDFLDSSLRHGIHTPTDIENDVRAPRVVSELYLILSEAAKDHASLESFEEKISAISSSVTHLVPCLTLADMQSSRIHILENTTQQLKQSLQIETISLHNEREESSRKDSHIKNLDDIVTACRNQIDILSGNVSDYENKILGQDEIITNQDAIIADREDKILDLIKQKEDRNSQIIDLNAAKILREGQILSLENALNEIKASTSWRVTAPLRAGGTILAPVKVPFKRVAARTRLRYIYAAMKKCPFFDTEWYLQQYPDVKKSGLDPLRHYLTDGWKEGRDPGPEFDARYYEARYPDIKKLKQAPLLHYWLHGRHENRHMNSTLDIEWLQTESNFIDSAEAASCEIDIDEPVYSEENPAFSVIIPTYNRLKLLPGIIESWRDVHKNTSFPYEIVFSDDGSSDGSPEYLETIADLPIRVLRNAHGGASHARNAAIRAARGERLLIIGDDIFPHRDILNVHYRLSRLYGRHVSVLGVVDWHKDLNVNHLMLHITEIGNEQFSFNRLNDNNFVDFRHFYTCNISVDREVILSEKAIFNERFDEYGFEDIELGYRLALKKNRIFFTTEAKGDHFHPYNIEGFCRRQMSAGRMAVTFCEIHPGMNQLLSIGIFTGNTANTDDDNLWKERLNAIIRRCDEYEKIIALLPFFASNPIRESLSAIYTRLFKAMYERGVLEKLEYRHSLTASMSRNFGNCWNAYWKLIEHTQPVPSNLDPVRCRNLADAFAMSDRTHLICDKEQYALYDELLAVKTCMTQDHMNPKNSVAYYRHILSRAIFHLRKNPRYLLHRAKRLLAEYRSRPLDLPTTATAVANAYVPLPALIIDSDLLEAGRVASLFRETFGEPASVYTLLADNLLLSNKSANPENKTVKLSDIDESVLFWPKSNEAILTPDQLLSGYIAIVENDLDIVIISNSLEQGEIISVGSPRNQMVFSKKIANAVLNGNINEASPPGKILRLLPATGTTTDLNLGQLIGSTAHVNDHGFFGLPANGNLPTHRQIPTLPARNKAKPVIFVFPIFLAVGGVERNTVEIMRQLKNDFDFIVITMERLRVQQGSLAAQASKVATHVIEMSEIVPHSHYLSLLARLNAHFRPDLIWICNGSPWLSDNSSALRQIFADVPIIDQEAYDVNEGWINRYSESGLRSFDRFIAINLKIQERFTRDFGIDRSRIDLIYSAIDSEHINSFNGSIPNKDEFRTKFDLPSNKKLFTFIGRLTPQKRPLEFLKLANKRRHIDDEHYVLVGNGELASEVHKFIEQNDMTNVTRIPYIENTMELHCISDGIIFTSAYEGLPIAMLEALAMGVPAFATDVGDIHVILDEYKAGSVTPVDCTEKQLNEDFSQWISNHATYVQNLDSSKGKIIERFSSKNIALQYKNSWVSEMTKYGRKIQ